MELNISRCEEVEKLWCLETLISFEVIDASWCRKLCGMEGSMSLDERNVRNCPKLQKWVRELLISYANN